MKANLNAYFLLYVLGAAALSLYPLGAKGEDSVIIITVLFVFAFLMLETFRWFGSKFEGEIHPSVPTVFAEGRKSSTYWILVTDLMVVC